MTYDAEKYEVAKQMYIDGMSLTQISKETGFERHKLSYLLKQDNVQVRYGTSKYAYREDFFKVVDTEEKAYWLGFMYADGNVINYGKYEIKISLAYQDLEHVKKFANIILLNGNGDDLVRPYTAKLKGKEYPSAKVCVTNKKIVEDIMKLGCIPNKTEQIIFPDNAIVPDYLVHHFIRGYFDGDGCISIPDEDGRRNIGEISFLGTKAFLEHILEIFDSVCTDFGKCSIGKRGNVYYFVKCKRGVIEELYQYMYKDASIYLERKYDKFASLYGKL